jgi:enoyl-CoA hydratase/carnithine racemase
MEQGGVALELRGPVQWIRIDRPERRNAFDAEVLRALARAVARAQEDPAVRAIVLTGAGDRAFSAGADLRAEAGESPFELDPARPRNPLIELFLALERCTLPTLARVNGHALAGGLGLVCACDFAVAVETATLGVPETTVGLFPMMILPYLLRTLPRRQLMEWCITGARWTAREALAAGILNYVVPPAELDAKVEWLLGRVLDKSPTAIRMGKQGLQAMRDMTLAQAFEYAQHALPAIARSEDAREGFAAFREGRPPRWTGR